MPELPDLEYIVPRLAAALGGKRVTSARVKEPIVLRIAVPGDLASVTAGRRIEAVARQGHFVRFALEDVELVVNLMLAGRFRLAPAAEKTERTLCFALEVEGGTELRFLDDMKMGKAYLVPRGREDLVPGLAATGVDILSKDFTVARFRELARKRRDQVRAFLLDKSALAAIGNAYADEILFEARLHPKTFVSKLAPEEIDALHGAIKTVMRHAIAEVARRGEPIEEKVRDFLSVRNRKGEPCPRCGAKIRSTIVRSADTYFCPECQPARRTLFVDWRNVPRSAPLAEARPSPSPSRRKRRRRSPSD